MLKRNREDCEERMAYWGGVDTAAIMLIHCVEGLGRVEGLFVRVKWRGGGGGGSHSRGCGAVMESRWRVRYCG